MPPADGRHDGVRPESEDDRQREQKTKSDSQKEKLVSLLAVLLCKGDTLLRTSHQRERREGHDDDEDLEGDGCDGGEEGDDGGDEEGDDGDDEG